VYCRAICGRRNVTWLWVKLLLLSLHTAKCCSSNHRTVLPRPRSNTYFVIIALNLYATVFCDLLSKFISLTPSFLQVPLRQYCIFVFCEKLPVKVSKVDYSVIALMPNISIISYYCFSWISDEPVTSSRIVNNSEYR